MDFAAILLVLLIYGMKLGNRTRSGKVDILVLLTISGALVLQDCQASNPCDSTVISFDPSTLEDMILLIGSEGTVE